MDLRSRSWTYLGVTTVTLLIWFWAASESREQRQVSAQVRFTTSDASSAWFVAPTEQAIRIRMEGSKWSLQKAEEALKSPVTMVVPPEVMSSVTDLAVALEEHESLRDTGVRILVCEPPVVEITVDRREHVEAPIRIDIAGIQTVGEIEIDPPQAVLIVPSLDRPLLPEGFFLEAVIEPHQLRDLAPAVKHTLTAALRLGEGVDLPRAQIEPAAAQVSFTIRSRIDEVVLDTVPVQIAGPHQDHDEYVIAMDNTLRDVRVWGEGELIQRIAGGEVKVIALLHLTSAEKEQLIESKPITCFLAMLPDGSVQLVSASVGGTTQPPAIRLTISERLSASSTAETTP